MSQKLQKFIIKHIKNTEIKDKIKEYITFIIENDQIKDQYILNVHINDVIEFLDV
mgnify:FL=1